MAVHVVIQWSVPEGHEAEVNEALLAISKHIAEAHPGINACRVFRQFAGAEPHRAYQWLEEYDSLSALEAEKSTEECDRVWQPIRDVEIPGARRQASGRTSGSPLGSLGRRAPSDNFAPSRRTKTSPHRSVRHRPRRAVCTPVGAERPRDHYARRDRPTRHVGRVDGEGPTGPGSGRGMSPIDDGGANDRQTLGAINSRSYPLISARSVKTAATASAPTSQSTTNRSATLAPRAGT